MGFSCQTFVLAVLSPTLRVLPLLIWASPSCTWSFAFQLLDSASYHVLLCCCYVKKPKWPADSQCCNTSTSPWNGIYGRGFTLHIGRASQVDAIAWKGLAMYAAAASRLVFFAYGSQEYVWPKHHKFTSDNLGQHSGLSHQQAATKELAGNAGH